MSIFSRKKDDRFDASAIMKEFGKIKEGGSLPRNGACKYFYESFTYAGETIPLEHKKGCAFFHIEHDDVMQEILAGTPTVGVEAGSERVFLSVVFKTGAMLNCIYLPFDLSHKDSVRILRQIVNRKSIEISLLNMAYGEILKEKTLTIPLPMQFYEELKKAAG